MKKRIFSLALCAAVLFQGVALAVSDWAAAEVQAADQAGLVVPSCSENMSGNINRQQFAELAVNLVEIATGQTITAANDDTFSDCTNESVKKAATAGIVNGVGGGLFDPYGGLTREQLATMLYRAWGYMGGVAQSSGLDGYTDAGSVSGWAAEAVGALAAADIMKGTSDSTLTPQGPCTVEQSILLVYRLYQRVTANNSTPRDEVLSDIGLGGGQGTIPEVPPSIVEHAPKEEPITIDMRTPSTPHRAPKEGDTIIRPDGTQVILARDPATGVLGWGQNVGPYLGTDCSKGKGTVGGVVEVNAWVMAAQHNGIWTDPLAAGWYRGCDVPGYEYTYLWTGEWDAVKKATRPSGTGTEGQADSTGLWVCDFEGDWIWQGPGQESPYQ